MLAGISVGIFVDDVSLWLRLLQSVCVLRSWIPKKEGGIVLMNATARTGRKLLEPHSMS